MTRDEAREEVLANPFAHSEAAALIETAVAKRMHGAIIGGPEKDPPKETHCTKAEWALLREIASAPRLTVAQYAERLGASEAAIKSRLVRIRASGHAVQSHRWREGGRFTPCIYWIEQEAEAAE